MTRSARSIYRRPLPPILFVFALLLVYWTAAAVIIAVDPYDLYAWGRTPHVDPEHFRRGRARFLVSVASRDKTKEVVSLGSSPAMMYSAQAITDALPGAPSALNLSYQAVRPLDRHIVMSEFARYSGVKRLLVWFDWSYALPPAAINDGFPAQMYDEDPLNDLRMVNFAALGDAWQMLVTGGPFPERPRSSAKADREEYEQFQTRENMEALARIIDVYRPDVDRPSRHDCDEFETLKTQTIPTVRALAARNVKVDFIIPAYSLMMYYPLSARRGGDVRLLDQLLMRRCLVHAAATIGGVRVVGLDADLPLVSDLAHYRDQGHVYGEQLANRLLKRIADPAYELTTANVDNYVERLHAAVKNYRIINSNLDRATHVAGDQ